jgi:hypothetical protein
MQSVGIFASGTRASIMFICQQRKAASVHHCPGVELLRWQPGSLNPCCGQTKEPFKHIVDDPLLAVVGNDGQ